MRGADTFTESLFTMRKLDDFVPADHPLRAIHEMVNVALVKMDVLFSGMYEADIKGGCPSIAPGKLLRAMLLQVFYSVRSERQLMKQTQYNLLFRWFIGLAMDDAVWVPTVFTKNRERLIEHDAVIELFNLVLEQAEHKGSLSRAYASAWTAPSSRLGPDIKALCTKTAATIAATAATSKAKAAAMTRTSPAQTPMHGCSAKATTPADCATRATTPKSSLMPFRK